MSEKGDIHLIVQDILRVRAELLRFPSSAEYKIQGKFPEIAEDIHTWGAFLRRAGLKEHIKKFDELERQKEESGQKSKILIFDIETAPILAYVWSIWQQDVGLNQIGSDWFIMAWAAKWLDEPEVFYRDQRSSVDVENDKETLEPLWELLNEADAVITQNGKAFDSKKVNARFILNGMKPPSPYKHIDTKVLAKRHFAFTSNKLEYLSEKLCGAIKKSKHEEFSGFDLWKGCLKGNVRAWEVMEKYNKQDVLATEALYKRLAPWGAGVELNLLHGESVYKCTCGSVDLQKRGFKFTASGKFQQFVCKACGAWFNSKGAGNNLFSDRKKASLKNLG